MVKGKEKEMGVKEEEKKEDERERRRDRVVFAEGVRCRLSLDEEPDVGAGSNMSNCTLLVHSGRRLRLTARLLFRFN